MEITYTEDGRKAKVDGFTFRRDMKTGYFLANHPTFNGKRERLHVYMWRTRKGEIPEGHHIHHIDGNKMHNEIENLACVTEHAHLSHHSKKYVKEHKKELVEHLEEIRPMANEWHRSKEGIEWHKEQYKKHGDAMHRKVERTCKQCGKKYITTLGLSLFCSNSCKSMWRRHAGIDNIEKTCPVCGKTFTINKYARTSCCSRKCGNKYKTMNKAKREE